MTRRPPTRRDVIITAAGELFAHHGYVATSTDEISAASGIAGPGIYRHFASKAEILGAVVDRATDRLLARTDQIKAEQLPSRPALLRLVDNLIDTLIADPAPFIVMMWERHHLERPALRRLDQAHRRHVDTWRQELAGMHPSLPTAEAAVICEAVIGLNMMACYQLRTIDPRELSSILRQMSARILDGAGHHQPPAHPSSHVRALA